MGSATVLYAFLMEAGGVASKGSGQPFVPVGAVGLPLNVLESSLVAEVEHFLDAGSLPGLNAGNGRGGVEAATT